MMDLKYLFTATYKDNTTYKQKADDISVMNPEKSAFFDVDYTNLKNFKLESQTFEDDIEPQIKNVVSVDLEDGHFELNGISFNLIDKPVENLKIIYYRAGTVKVVTPAIFYNARKSETLEDGSLRVTNSKGEITIFDKVATIGQTNIIENDIPYTVLTVLPEQSGQSINSYIIGWEGNIVGKKKKISRIIQIK